MAPNKKIHDRHKNAEFEDRDSLAPGGVADRLN
jgi:hypothetical protein